MVALSQIRDFSARLADEYHPERIVLFGSYANGEPRDDSDVDLLVVMGFHGKGLRKAAEMVRRLHPRFAVDLIVKTPQELRRRLADEDALLEEALANGTVLYEAPDS